MTLADEILDLLSDKQWHSAVQINNFENKTITGLRQMRKLRVRGYVIDKRIRDNTRNHFEYRLTGEPCRFVNNQACFA